MISLIPREDVPTIWHIVEPLLAKSVARSSGRDALKDVHDDLIWGKQSLWVALDGDEIIGCCTVRIIQYATGLRTLSYEHLGGKDVERWLFEGHEILQNYAKDYECTRLEVPQGRKGWTPLLKKIGYRTFAIRYEFELKD